MKDREIFVCECESFEHQYCFWYDEDDNELFFYPHLYFSSNNWFERLIGKIRYLFGYKSFYGAWDAVLINPDDAAKIRVFLDKLESEHLKRAAENED